MQTSFFFLLIFAFGIAAFILIRPFVYPIFWAAVLAVTFYPFYRWVNKHISMPKVSSFLSVVVVVVIILLPLTFVSALLVNESLSLYRTATQESFLVNIEGIMDDLSDTPLEPYIGVIQEEWPRYVKEGTEAISRFILSQVTTITQNSVAFVFMLFLMLYTLYYFFLDGPKMLNRLRYLSPLGDKYENELYKRFTSTTKATLKGTLIIGGIQGILSAILFFIVGIPGAFVWGVIMIIISIIPSIGSALVLYPAGIILMFSGNITGGLVLIIGATLISFIDNLMRPPMIGRDTQMHPILVLFGTLGGIAVFGLSGFIIGPIIMALFLSVISIYTIYYKRELEKN